MVLASEGDGEVSRQNEWQKKQVAQGKCPVCGKKPDGPYKKCNAHVIAARIRDRKRSGHKKYNGTMGRPPKVPEA